MQLSRRGLILGGSALLAGCATNQAVQAPVQLAQTPVPVPSAPRVVYSQARLTPPPLDPQRQVRPELMQRAMQALDVHHDRLPLRDRMYLVDFQKYSGEERFYEVDLYSGQVQAFRTCHGKGSDPQHSGYARSFSNTPESFMSSVGAYSTAGAGWGAAQGPNVLLDGLEYTNNLSR